MRKYWLFFIPFIIFDFVFSPLQGVYHLLVAIIAGVFYVYVRTNSSISQVMRFLLLVLIFLAFTGFDILFWVQRLTRELEYGGEPDAIIWADNLDYLFRYLPVFLARITSFMLGALWLEIWIRREKSSKRLGLDFDPAP